MLNKNLFTSWTKRKLITSILVIAFLAGGTFLITRQIFKANVAGSFTISGSIYSPNRNEARPDIKALDSVNISLSSSTNPETTPITTFTDASGSYSITAPSADFNNISITKDGYWDINGVISNYDDSDHFTLNLDLKTGFGQEDAQIFVPKKDSPNKFGLSINPFDVSPASIIKINSSGENYSSSSIASSFLYFNQRTGDFDNYDKAQATMEHQMAEVIKIASACKEYAGANKVTLINDPTFADDNTKFDGLKAGNQAICDTSAISDPIQQAEATGNYPKLPDGYEYYPPNGMLYGEPDDNGNFIITHPNLDDTIVSIEKSPLNGSNNLNCSLTGCARGSEWGTVSLYRGQTLSLMDDQWSWNSEAIVIRGTAKMEPVSISAQANKPVYVANPYMDKLGLLDIQIKDGDKTYSLKDAQSSGLIQKDAILIDTNGMNQLDLTQDQTNTILEPGDILNLTTLKSVIISTVPATAFSNQNTVSKVEIPSSISVDDIKTIAAHKAYSSNQEKAKYESEKAVLLAMTRFSIKQQNLKTDDFELPNVYLSKNNKIIETGQMNPYSTQKYSAGSNIIGKTLAADAQPSFSLSVDQDSFGGDSENYALVKNFVDGNVGKIKTIMGEPIFINNVEIYNVNPSYMCSIYSKELDDAIKSFGDEAYKQYIDDGGCQNYFMDDSDNASYDPVLNIINVDTNGEFIKPSLGSVLLHEISHSWRNVLGSIYYSNWDEGMAQGFVYAFTTLYGNDIADVPLPGPVQNFDYWSKEVMQYYNPEDKANIMPRLGTIDDGVDFLPKGRFFWVRQMYGTTIFKLFTESYAPGVSNFFEYFDDTLFQKVVSRPDFKNQFAQNSQFEKSFFKVIFDMKQISDDDLMKMIASVPYADQLEGVNTIDWLKRSAIVSTTNITGSVDNFAVMQYPNNQSLCLEGSDCHSYDGKSAIFYSEPEPGLTGIDAITKTKFDLRLFVNDQKALEGSPTTDDNGAIDLSSLFDTFFNMSPSYFGSAEIINTSTFDGSAVVSANNVFVKNGAKAGTGVFGTTDLPDGTGIDLTYTPAADSSSQPVRLSSMVENGAYEFPQATAWSQCELLVPSKVIVKKFNKWQGDYEYDLKTDETLPNVTDISEQDNEISFSLDKPAATFIEYGKAADNYDQISFGKTDGGYNEGDNFQSGQRSINLENLDYGTIYHYRVWAIDHSGNISKSSDQNFATSFVANIKTTINSQTSVTVTWETPSADTTDKLDYGLTTSYGITTPVETTASKTHSVKLDNLTAGKTYHFRINAHTDSPAEDHVSIDRTFIIFTISNIQINADAVDSDNKSGATISWSTSTATAGYVEFGRDTTYGFKATEVIDPKDPSHGVQSSHSVFISQDKLTVGIIYHLRVKAYIGKETDSAGLYSLDQTFLFNPCGITPGVQTDSMVLWSTGNYSDFKVDIGLAADYGTHLDLAGHLTDEAYYKSSGYRSNSDIIPNLTPLTHYHYQVTATPAGSTTPRQCGGDRTVNTAISPITNVKAQATTTSATIEWDTDINAESQLTYYDLRVSATVPVATVSSTIGSIHRTITLSSLPSNHWYKFTIKSTGFGYTTTAPGNFNTIIIPDIVGGNNGVTVHFVLPTGAYYYLPTLVFNTTDPAFILNGNPGELTCPYNIMSIFGGCPYNSAEYTASLYHSIFPYLLDNRGNWVDQTSFATRNSDLAIPNTSLTIGKSYCFKTGLPISAYPQTQYPKTSPPPADSQAIPCPAGSLPSIPSGQTLTQSTSTAKSQSAAAASQITSITQNSQTGSVSYITTQSVSTEIQYGTLAGSYSKNIKPTDIAYPAKGDQPASFHSARLPDLKSLTYHFRIVSTDVDGNVTYSQDYTLKHGNWFLRFFGDLWEKTKSIF